jgi:DNA polymerase/3'-5' exonuclease PolX
MNSNIILWFEKLINYLEMTLQDKKKEDKLKYSFKINSLKKSLKVIREIDFEIKSGNDIKDYKSIGDGTIKRIDEILKTGRLDEVKDNNINLDELINVFGIGKKKALELYTKYNISTIKELKEAKIKLPDNILKGLEYVDKIKEKIPRKEIDKINLYLLECVRNIDKELNLIVCGSYRRENDFSNYIDIIITHPKIITKKDEISTNIYDNFILNLI